MTHVVTEPCIRCRYTDCVESCPVNCFHVGPTFVVIDPECCIDCALCVPTCPIEAIKHADELTPSEEAFRALNVKYARVWPVGVHRAPPLPDREAWREVQDKRPWLEGPEPSPNP